MIFGIDGADWKVIEPLVARGRLPHFRRLIEEGATGTLQSMEPSASPSLWTTIATGFLKRGVAVLACVSNEDEGRAVQDAARGSWWGARCV